jgi:hypothetical protein
LATTLIQARKLLTTAELDLFAASRGDALKGLAAVQLRGKVKRSRTLRDKYQDLLRRQKVATRGRTGSKAGASGVANERTAQKAEVFAEVLARFEQRLAQLEAAAARAALKTAAAEARLARLAQRQAKASAGRAPAPVRSPKAPAKVPAAAKKVGPTSERARTARHAMQPKAAGLQKIQSHVSASGRRAQAKRDSRR